MKKIVTGIQPVGTPTIKVIVPGKKKCKNPPLICHSVFINPKKEVLK